MDTKNTKKIFSCLYCDYVSNRKYNLQIHETNKHSKEILKESIQIQNNISNNIKENVMNVEENVMNIKENVMNIEENVMNIKNKYYCSKCSKEYLTFKYLTNHEEKCLGINILSCPKCMKEFSNRHNKSAHIKNNNCKAKSIIHAKQPNVQTVQNIQHIETQNNTINNITNNNTYIINNYGNERIDYLSNEDMYNILMSCNNIPLYIEQKHFNKNFPENHNIQYDDKSKRCKIKENDKWKTINLSLMSTKLINDSSNSLLVYFNKNKEELNNKIHNEELYYFILNKLLLIKNKNDKEKYNTLYNLIKFIIENNTFDTSLQQL
jgi:hypothetical protein